MLRNPALIPSFARSSFLLATLLGVLPIFGSTITVTNMNDSGAGSLRNAIASASPGDAINFSVTGTIILSSTLTVGTNLTLSGPGASSVAISGNNAVEVFTISTGVSATISGVTIQNGKSNYGGGVSNFGTLTLDKCTLSGNSATGFGGGGILNFSTLTLTNSMLSGNSAIVGGAIFNYNGTLTLTDSTLSANSATVYGGAIRNNSGTVTVNNSTLSGNSATQWGGVIFNDFGKVTVTNSTLSGNSAASGGGVFNYPSSTATVNNSTLSGNSSGGSGGNFTNFGTLMIKNTILSNKPQWGNCQLSGTATSNGHNLSDDTSCSSLFTSVGDANNVPAGLDPAGLQNNGGPTQTIALLPSSPAVDAVPLSFCTLSDGITPVSTDQRGESRPQGTACDIGAFELVQCAGPVITGLSASPNSLWPPNHKMVPVTVSASYTGGCGSVACKIIAVTSNEPSGPDGDWLITGNLTLQLRAERLGLGGGRVYTITIQCKDASGNATTKTVTVTVPHDQGN